jgi:hypothetical protein
MKKKRGSIFEDLEIIQHCFSMLSRETTSKKGITAVRAGMVAVFKVAGAIDPVLAEMMSKNARHREKVL